jgi:hypothetical protein
MANSTTPRAYAQARLLDALYAEWRFPGAVRALEAGEALRFEALGVGPLVLQGGRLTVAGDGRVFPAASCAVRRNSLILADGTSARAISLNKLSNCKLLLALLRHCHEAGTCWVCPESQHRPSTRSTI